MGYHTEKPAFVEYICEHVFWCIYFALTYNVYVANLGRIIFKMYIRSYLYLRLISKIADLIPLCVVALNFSLGLLMPMHHVSAKFSTLILLCRSWDTYDHWDGTCYPYSLACCPMLDITISFSSSYMGLIVWSITCYDVESSYSYKSLIVSMYGW